MTEKPKTHSIAPRLRRVTYEDAYIAVPATSKVVKVGPDGSGSIDFEVLVAEAIRIGGDDRVEWKVEETRTEPHPTQGPLPEGRTCFDAYYSDADTRENGPAKS